MKLSEEYTEIVGVTHRSGEEECHNLMPKIAHLEEENKELKRLLGEWREIVGETARLSWASALVTKTDALLTAEVDNE